MKTQLEKSFAKRGLTISGVCHTHGLIYQTVWQHFNGLRRVKAEQAIKYELILGIPRSELRPDLWPPDGLTATPTTPPEPERSEGGEDAA